MSRSLRRGALAAIAIAFSTASLSACGAGQDAQTLGVQPDNAATSVGNIKIQNALVITQAEADAKGPAVVSATLFNEGSKPETLEGIKFPGANAEVKVTPATGSGPVTVPAGGSLILGGKGNASAVVVNGREAAEPGEAQEVVFEFSDAGDVGLEAFVVPATGYYQPWGPSEAAPQPGAEPSKSGSESGEPGEPAGSGEPTGQASGEPAEDGEEAGAGTPSDESSASHGAGH
ncbi:DUF461 domain-containing protein [Streptomyces sp. NPDC051219]|uniref:DUF461 domain-containing protein n=1 Tax=Streptomyces sp. NPDC051219 TaxID=3155283 RepID=UPI0034374BF1